MKTILTRSKKWQSIAIQVVTWSKWSHAGVIIGEWVYEASGPAGGVIKTPLADFLARYSDVLVLELPHTKGYENRAEELVGSPYDYGALAKHLTRFEVSNPQKWYCFELVGYISGAFNPALLDRITATHIEMFGKPTTLTELILDTQYE